MSIRRSVTTVSLLTASLAAACGAPPGDPTGESESALSPAIIISQPIATPWQSGFTANGIIAGMDIDRTPLYPCRATLAVTGQLTPGKTRHDWNWCAISYGGTVYQETTYATLAPEWIADTNGAVPAGAVPAGTAYGQTLFTCRTTVAGALVVGQVGAGLTGCEVPDDGIAVSFPSYQVLSVPSATFGFFQTPVIGGDPIPYFALQAGTDASGQPIYPCTALYEGSTLPGQLTASLGRCQISYEGLVYSMGSFSVFEAWIEPANGAPFLAGTDSGGGALGVCTASYASSIQVGKYIPASGLCDFPFGTSEVASGQFNVLETKK